MEEKERYIILSGKQIKDTTNNSQYFLSERQICDLLNQQDKQILELQEEIENLKIYLEDKNKIIWNDNNQAVLCGDCYCINNDVRRIIKENQQLKQQLHDLPKQIVGEIKSYYTTPIYDDPYADTKVGVLLDRLDTILKKYGVEE